MLFILSSFLEVLLADDSLSTPPLPSNLDPSLNFLCSPSESDAYWTLTVPHHGASPAQEYEELAVALGTDHKRRLALREQLKAVRLTCPLFDTRRWVAGVGTYF